jgi:hypothetical protein
LPVKDPAQAELLKRVDPEYYAKRELAIDQRADLERELAKLSLYGYPQNEAQLKLLYLISSGQVRAPMGQLWNPSTWTDVNGGVGPYAPTDARIERGLFSGFSRTYKGNYDNNKAPFDILGGVLANNRRDPSTVSNVFQVQNTAPRAQWNTAAQYVA